MKYFTQITTAILATTVLFFQANTWAVDTSAAESLIKTTTDDVLADPDRLADHAEAGKLVDKVFSFSKMSKLVLGKNWKKINDSQKQRFVDAFRGLLIRTYSKALMEAAGKVKKIKYSSRETNEGRVKVSAEVHQTDSSDKIDIDYDMYESNDGWKVYNVSVGGVSLVTNYRSEFATDFKNMGIDGLINKIENQDND